MTILSNIFKSLLLVIFSTTLFLQKSFAQYEFQDLDGVKIKAIEEYPSIKTNEFTVGFTTLPFDPYYYGYALNLGYNRYFDKKWGWNVLDLLFIFGSEKPLTTGLVENEGVSPSTIEKAEFLLASNAKYVLSYGKSIFFDQYIRLTRTELIFGLGGMSTSEQTLITINTGFQLDFVMSEKFSWKVEFVNYYPPSKSDVAFLDYAAISLKSAWRFE
jgi:hypothetical protein